MHRWDESHYRQEAARIYELIRQAQSQRYRWLRPEVFKKTLVADLRRDARALHEILSATGEIPFAKDKKLQSLINLLAVDCRDHVTGL